MGIAERSRARVEDLLSDLERTYESFPVNQRTLTLSGERYERARREYADDAVDTFVRIENDAGEVLQVTEDGESALPGAVGYPEDAIERDLEERVAAETGVECSIDGLAEVTIAGISNADADDDAVLYRLLVVYSATYSGGEPAEGVEWQAVDADPQPAFV